MSKQPHFTPLAASNQSRSVSRALAAIAIGAVRRENPEEILHRNWPADDMAATVLKAASTISDTTTITALLSTAVGGFLGGLAPQSAAVRLFERCMRLDFQGVYQLNVPRASTSVAPIFVGEGLPHPIAQDVFANVTVGPTKKMLLGAAITNELENYSVQSATAIIETVMREQAGRSLDAAVFSTSSLRPAGLLNGYTGFTATAGGGLAAVVGDLKNLIGAISDANLNADNAIIVANPRQAIALRLLASPSFTHQVFSTNALAAGTVVMLAPDAIASGYSGLPVIEVSKEALVHMEDTAPLAISTTPSPVVAPLRSTFQTDTSVLRLRLNCTWQSLVPGTTTGAVSFVTSTTW